MLHAYRTQKNRHQGTITQLRRAITKACIDNWGKKLVPPPHVLII